MVVKKVLSNKCILFTNILILPYLTFLEKRLRGVRSNKVIPQYITHGLFLHWWITMCIFSLFSTLAIKIKSKGRLSLPEQLTRCQVALFKPFQFSSRIFSYKSIIVPQFSHKEICYENFSLTNFLSKGFRLQNSFLRSSLDWSWIESVFSEIWFKSTKPSLSLILHIFL